MKNTWEVVEVSKESYDFLRTKLNGVVFFREEKGKYYIKLLSSIKNKTFK